MPPIYSALNIDGKRAYELAREGVDVELSARPVIDTHTHTYTHTHTHTHARTHARTHITVTGRADNSTSTPSRASSYARLPSMFSAE